jgi:WD40 repeat protein
MLLGHPDEPLQCCSISLDDEYVVVGGDNGGVYSWDTTGGAEYRQYEDGHSGKVTTVMCYPMEDGSHVIISCGGKLKDHRITVWDLETTEQRAQFKIDELEDAKNVRYHISKDGTQVLVWCTDQVPFPNMVFVDALNDGKNSVLCHGGLIRSAVFGKDSAKIISCGGDGNVTVWDTASLEAQMSLSGHQGTVLCCGINEAGTHIVSSGDDCTVRLWSAEDGKQLQSMEAQDSPVRLCMFDKSNTKILACDVTGRVYVWTLMSEVILNLIRRYAETLSCIAMSLDQTLMAAGCNNGRIMMWDVEKRELIWESSLHQGRVEALAFNTLDELASAGQDGRISIVSVETGKQNSVFMGQEEPIFNVAFSPDDERIAGCSADGKLLVFTINQTKKNKLVLRSNIARVTNFVWSPNSKLIAGCCSDGTVLIWNANSGSIFTVLEGDSIATCCTFDYVGKLVAVGTVMGNVVIYNLETREMLCELSNNASAIRSVMFSHDTSRLTSVCSRQAIVWDVASSSKIRTFDFVADPHEQFRSKPHPYRSTVAHKGTAIFDPESETVVYDMASVEDSTMRSYFLSDTRLISCGFKGVVVWSAEGGTSPDKYHTTHDAITSCHFSFDDRLCVMGTQVSSLLSYLPFLYIFNPLMFFCHAGWQPRALRCSAQ